MSLCCSGFAVGLVLAAAIHCPVGVARFWLRVDLSSFQLIVPMKDELDGTTVECVYEDLLTNEESVIGQIHLTLTTGMYNMDTYMILHELL